MGKMNWLDILAIIFLTAGGLLWGLSVFNVGFGAGFFAKVIYLIVGLSAVYSMYTWIKLAVK